MADALIKDADLLLQVSDLTVSFNGTEVIAGVNLTVDRGELLAIIGRSGSGKTTLLRAINRLNECFDGASTFGRIQIHLDGQWHSVYGPNALPLTVLRRRVGMVFQNPNVLPTSIERNFRLPLQLAAGLSGAQIRQRMEEALGQAQLWGEVKDRLHHPATTLSGGQQMRLCLARALALEPQILLLDEPTSSVDHVAATRIEALLHDLKARYTMILVSHSLGQTRRLADRLAVMKQGCLAGCLERGQLDDDGIFKELINDIF